jgi:iron complex transport system ATP-binding protein
VNKGLIVSGATYRVPGRTLLDHVHFCAPARKITGLIGPNGSGKSTLLRGVLGLLPLTGGTSLFDGSDMLSMPRRERARVAAFVEQGSSTESRLSVLEVVLLGRIPFQSVWASDHTARDLSLAKSALARVDMGAFCDRPYHQLSGGEQQRVQIARALVQEPRLLILDEPTSNLDVHAQLLVFKLLRQVSYGGATVIVALHDLNFASENCDHLLLLDQGRKLAEGAPAEVLTPALLRAAYGVVATPVARGPGEAPLITFSLPDEDSHPDNCD